MLLGDCHAFPGFARQHDEKQHEKVNESENLEENTPATGFAVLVLGLAQQFLDEFPLSLIPGTGRWGLIFHLQTLRNQFSGCQTQYRQQMVQSINDSQRLTRQ